MRTLFLLFLLAFSSLSQAARYNTKIAEKMPVNNDQIKIPPFPVNNVNTYASEMRDIAEHENRLIDGHVTDEFIPYNEGRDYIDTLPNGRLETITKKDVERIRKQQMKEEGEELAEYFIMRKRILAPTMKEH